ncbi:hypothetical protein HY041_03440, partial [Candidatus Roizmanbacteria bacterium]|nr:hypothetical protein [Candidatus Roizmanbacteria bacterium]
VLYYSLFFFTPLIMASITSELFEFNKMLFIYSIAVLVLFFWIIKIILHKKIILKKTPFDIPLLLFLGSQLIATVISIDTHTSLYGYYGRFNGGLFSIIAYLVLYFGFTTHFFGNTNGFQIIEKVLKTSLLSSFLVILWGLPGKFGFDLSCFVFTGQLNNVCWTDQFHPELRMFSTLGQPNWLGAYLAIHFFIGLYFLLKALFIPEYTSSFPEKKGYVKKVQKNISMREILLYGYLFLNFSAVLFTRSRSALVSVVGGLLLLFLFGGIYFKNKIAEYRVQILSIVILVVVITLSLIIFKSGFGRIDRYLEFSFPTKKEQ